MTTTGCHTKFAAATTSTTAATANKKFGPVSLECDLGGFILINISSGGCVIKIGNQTPNGGAEYINTGSGSTADIDVETHVTGLTFTSSGGLCAFGGVPASGTEGVYKGNTTLKAFTDNNVPPDEGKTGVYNEGAQLGTSKS